jgi:uncharacterized protein
VFLNSTRHPRYCLTWILLLLLINGCVGKTTRTQFYILDPVSSPSKRVRLPANIGVIGVGPVRIPKYLDRPQIVTRSGRNEIRVNELHQWAGPLKYDLARVLRENLSVLLEGHHTVPYPWKNTEGVSYQIKITFHRLDVENGTAILKADWSIAATRSPKAGKSYRSTIEAPVLGTSFAEKVSAINDGLNQFSLEVAQALTGQIAHETDFENADSKRFD